jgi:hypothetical protein
LTLLSLAVMIMSVMNIKRYLFPMVGCFLLIADIPPGGPGCVMNKPGRVADAIAAAKLSKD